MAGVATWRQEEALAANSLPNLFIVVACYLTARRPPCSKVFPGGLDRSSWWPSCATAAPPPPCDRQCPRCRRQSRRQRQHRRQQQQQHQQQWQRYKMTSDDVLQPSATTAAVAKMSHRRPLPRARPSSPLHPRGASRPPGRRRPLTRCRKAPPPKVVQPEVQPAERGGRNAAIFKVALAGRVFVVSASRWPRRSIVVVF